MVAHRIVHTVAHDRCAAFVDPRPSARPEPDEPAFDGKLEG